MTFENLDRLVMPAIVEVDFKDGSHQRIALPAETLDQEPRGDVRLDSTQPIGRDHRSGPRPARSGPLQQCVAGNAEALMPEPHSE